MTRGRSVGALPRQLVSQVFTLKKGQATFSETPAGAAVAQVIEVAPADLSAGANAELLDAWSLALDNSVGQDIYAYYGIAIQDRDGATVNPQALEYALNLFR